jgi:hypothetical protein
MGRQGLPRERAVVVERESSGASRRRVVDLVRDEEWVLAARREAEFADRDGYDTTAALLRGCADEIERLESEVEAWRNDPTR